MAFSESFMAMEDMNVPRRKIGPKTLGLRGEELLKVLVEEFKNPSDNPSRPDILEEGGEGSKPLHLYVVWDEWADLPQEDRSDLIMDAFIRSEGEEKGYLVTVAMGLTHDEAKRMKLGVER